MSLPRQPESFGAKFGSLVRYKRGLEGLTQEALAAQAFDDIGAKSRISQLENGRIAAPQQRTVDSLAIALGIHPDEIEACRLPHRDDGSNAATLNTSIVSQRLQVLTDLGGALASLGKVTHSTAPLEEALAAYREALAAVSRETRPYEWAHLQSCVGRTLQALGEEEKDASLISEAIDAFRNALKALDSNHKSGSDPDDWPD